MPLDYTALVTVEEVRKALLGSGGRLDTTLADAGSADYAQCEDVIEDVTGRIEDDLNRLLIVREHIFRFRCGLWRPRQGWEDGEDSLLFVTWARQWPVVRIASVDEVAGKVDDMEIGEYKAGAQMLAYDPNSTLITEHPWQVVATAGFRREDQAVIADLRTASGLDADQLPALPPVLPRAIRRAAIRLTISELVQEREGLVGVASRSRQVEGATVQSLRANTSYEDEVLRTIFPYKYMPA